MVESISKMTAETDEHIFTGWMEEWNPKEISYCPEHRNPRSGAGQRHKLSW